MAAAACTLWVVVLAARAQSPSPAPGAPPGSLRSALYPDDWQPGYRDAEGRFLQDYSYAGYHNGEQPLPTGNHGRVFDVTAPPYGADPAGQHDASAAIQKAIGDAEAAGAGIVYLPAGLYKLSDSLRVQRSRIVLRGAGSDGANATRLHFVDGGRQSPNIHFGVKAEYGVKQRLTQDANIFDSYVAVADVAGLAVGDDIVIGCRITEEFLAEHHMQDFWGVNQKDKVRHFFRRRIARVDPVGRRLLFKVPIRYPMRVRDAAAVIKTTGVIEECGLEHLAICNATAAEQTAWDARPGWAAIRLSNAADCWICDVRSFESPECPPFHLRSIGIAVSSSKQVTVADCDLARPQNRGGGGNGYLFVPGGSNEVLFQDCVGRHGRHNFCACNHFGNAGNVYLRAQTSDGMSFADWAHREAAQRGEKQPWRSTSDYHMALAIACLVDQSVIDDGWNALNRGHWSAESGHTAAQCVFWNSRGQGSIRSFQYGWGYVIGTGAGLDVRTTAPRAGKSDGCREDDGTEPYDDIEHIGAGAQMSVQSLYEDQLARRLAGRRETR